MQISILYFAGLRHAVGRERERLELPASVSTVGMLATYLEEREPVLRGRLAGTRFARNEEIADPTEPLAAGDVIALLPPFAGG